MWDCVNYVYEKLARESKTMGGEGKQTNYRHRFISRLPYGQLSLLVRFQVIQGIAYNAMYFSSRCNTISASMKACGETGILISSLSKSGPVESYMIHSDTSPFSLLCEGPPLMLYILPVCVLKWIQRVTCLFYTSETSRYKMLQTCHSALLLMWRTFSWWTSLIVQNWEDLIPLILCDG